VASISAKQIVAHTNMGFCWAGYPGVKNSLVSAADVTFTP